MLNRKQVLECIVEEIGENDYLISALGYISRDLHSITNSIRSQCFYCMGSMGSVAPLSLGVALACPTIRVWGIEGDGSILMNLGAIATLKRYGCRRINLIIFDNRCYESTGGQVSQPPNLYLENVFKGAGLITKIANNIDDVKNFIRSSSKFELEGTKILVVKLGVDNLGVSQRINESPNEIASRFSFQLRQTLSNSNFKARNM